MTILNQYYSSTFNWAHMQQFHLAKSVVMFVASEWWRNPLELRSG